MHSNNAYLLRAEIAERELKIAVLKGQHLAAEYEKLYGSHYHALKTLEIAVSALLTTRHRLLTTVSRLFGMRDVNPGQMESLRKGIRTALASMPAPGALPVQEPEETPGPKLAGPYES